MPKIKRSKFKTFLNTGTALVPTWSLISEGVPEAREEYNPAVVSMAYIGEDNESVSLESYAPKISVPSICITGDAVFDWIDTLRKGRDLLDDAETEIVNVWYYDEEVTGVYEAIRQSVVISVEDFGGVGGESTKLGYTINFVGDPESGFFVAADLAWVLNPPLLATLSALAVIEAFTPVFDEDTQWYEVDTTAATNAITWTLANGGSATCFVDGVEYDHGEAIIWAEGLNIVIMTITVGDEVGYYFIQVTKS